MEILALFPSGTLGGSEKNFLLYAERLAGRARYRLAVWEKGTGRFLARAARMGIETMVAGPPPAAMRRLAAWTRRSDLLHSYLLKGHLLAAPLAAWGGKPWFAAERGMEDFRGPGGRGLRRALLARADRVLPVSPVVAARVRDVDGIPPERIEVVPGGLDLAGIGAALSAAPSRGRAAAPRVLCVAHLRREKRVDLVVDAFAFARRARGLDPAATLDLAGEGPERPRIETMIRRHDLGGAVRLLGEVPVAFRIMPEYDLLVLASEEEGFPNAILEAQATGLPVLASDVEGVRQFVEEGRTGHLFRAGDAEHLAERLAALLSDPRRASIAPAARAHAERYEVGGAAARLGDLYEAAIRV